MVRASPERPPGAVSRALREYQKWVRRWTFELTYCVNCDRPTFSKLVLGLADLYTEQSGSSGRTPTQVMIHTLVRAPLVPSAQVITPLPPSLTTNTNVFYDFILCMGYWPIELASYIILPF